MQKTEARARGVKFFREKKKNRVPGAKPLGHLATIKMKKGQLGGDGLALLRISKTFLLVKGEETVTAQGLALGLEYLASCNSPICGKKRDIFWEGSASLSRTRNDNACVRGN